jgi:hypothetical protein
MLADSTPTNIANASKLPTREKIQQLQESMLEIRSPMPDPEHFFAPGMYGRKLVISAGTLVVGKIHKHSHLMMVLQGKAEVITEFDRTVVGAGHVSVSQPGAKRVVLAIEDTTFMTVHHNPKNTENLDDIETEHMESEDFKIEYHKSNTEELPS